MIRSSFPRSGAITLSLHPAGHVLGSAQVRLAHDDGRVWVVTDDYKRDPDPTCAPFEVIPCDTRNTVEKFGPVRSLKPQQVLEIAFEGIQSSPRHKSGIALRFPRIVRWRQDKPVEEADTLDQVREQLRIYGS